METKIKLKRKLTPDGSLIVALPERTPLAPGEPAISRLSQRPCLYIGGTGASNGDTEIMDLVPFIPAGWTLPQDLGYVLESGTNPPPSTGTQAKGKIYIQYID